VLARIAAIEESKERKTGNRMLCATFSVGGGVPHRTVVKDHRFFSIVMSALLRDAVLELEDDANANFHDVVGIAHPTNLRTEYRMNANQQSLAQAIASDPEDVIALAEIFIIVREIGGLSQRGVCALARQRYGLGRDRVTGLLRLGTQLSLWDTEDGAFKSRLFFEHRTNAGHSRDRSIAQHERERHVECSGWECFEFS
jgi:hypothetical protein